MARRNPNNAATLKILQDECDRFNARVKVGETVAVFLDNGDCGEDVIEGKATVLSGHTCVAWLKTRGCYALSRVRKKV